MTGDVAESPNQFGRVATIGELATWWLEHVAAHAVRASSLGRYRDRVTRITATLGDNAVIDLRSEDVARWMTELTRAGPGRQLRYPARKQAITQANKQACRRVTALRGCVTSTQEGG